MDSDETAPGSDVSALSANDSRPSFSTVDRSFSSSICRQGKSHQSLQLNQSYAGLHSNNKGFAGQSAKTKQRKSIRGSWAMQLVPNVSDKPLGSQAIHCPLLTAAQSLRLHAMTQGLHAAQGE